MNRQELLEFTVSNKVCRHCGSKLEILMVDGANHCVCMNCDRIEFGTDKDIFDFASNEVELDSWKYKNEYEKGYKKSEICDIVTKYINRNVTK